jgi:hypothetical protein
MEGGEVMFKKERRALCAVTGCPTTPKPGVVRGKKVVYTTCSEHRGHEDEANAFYRTLRHKEGAHQLEKLDGCELCYPTIKSQPEQLTLDIQGNHYIDACGCQGRGE